MSSDEPLALEPARGLSPLVKNVLTALVAFVAGIAGMAAFTWLRGGDDAARPVPAPAPVTQPQQMPVRALPPGTDVATLSAREQILAGRLDVLETRLRDIDGSARNASSYATQAERLMIAFSVRRLLERGDQLGPLEAQLRRRFGETHGEAVSIIVQAANQAVTLEDLRAALEAIAPRLLVAPDAGLWTRATGLFGDLVVLRRDDTPSPRAADRLKRAQRMLAEGQVEGALAEIARMPGAASAENWVNNAKRYIAARNALREIELAAMATPGATPAAPPATTR
jgi:hypothetical protein